MDTCRQLSARNAPSFPYMKSDKGGSPSFRLGFKSRRLTSQVVLTMGAGQKRSLEVREPEDNTGFLTRIAGRAEDCRWSSASAHPTDHHDALTKISALAEILGDWSAFLSEPTKDGEGSGLQRHERTGRPLGDEVFLTGLEGIADCVLTPQKAGPRPRRQWK